MAEGFLEGYAMSSAIAEQQVKLNSLAHIATGLAGAVRGLFGEAPAAAIANKTSIASSAGGGVLITAIGDDLIPWSRVMIEDQHLAPGTAAVLTHGLSTKGPVRGLVGVATQFGKSQLFDLVDGTVARYFQTFGVAPKRCVLLICGIGKNAEVLQGAANRSGVNTYGSTGFARFTEEGIIFSSVKEGFFFEPDLQMGVAFPEPIEPQPATVR
jgi:hypothetical protein